MWSNSNSQQHTNNFATDGIEEVLELAFPISPRPQKTSRESFNDKCILQTQTKGQLYNFLAWLIAIVVREFPEVAPWVS